jgi:hypothetical protein
VVDHSGLVEDDRRLRTDMDGAGVRARAVSAASESVLPWSAGLSVPSRSAVEPETAIPIVLRPANCSALVAASITTPLPVPAGPTSTLCALGSGQDE